MLLEQNGTVKRHVVIEGAVGFIDHATVRKSETASLITYQWQVLVEFDANSERTIKRNVYCNYYVKPTDEAKKASAEMLSTLQHNERIICFGFASAGKMYSNDRVNASAPLSMSVSSFILPDRLNALMASLTNYEKTVADIEDDGTFDIEQKRSKTIARRKRQVATKKPKTGKSKKETPKYGFD